MVSFRRNRLPKAERPPRSVARKVLIGFNIVLALILLVGVAGFGYTNWRFGQVGRLALDSLRGEGDAGSTMNVLLVGSDSREQLTEEEKKVYGDTTDAAGQRSDTIMVMHIDPKQEKAAILSIPRDAYVTISATGKKAKINEAFQTGPDGLITTIKDNFDIPIDHYAQVDFEGFKGVVNAINGVEIPFDAPARDKKSGLNIIAAGCPKLDGDMALAYARSRFYEAKLNGKWVSDPRSDLGRIARQQDFIRRVIRQTIDSSSNPLTLNAVISNGVKNVHLDSGFSSGDMFKIAKRFRSLDPNTVEMLTIPTTRKFFGSVDAQAVNEDEAKAIVDRFLNGPPKEEVAADIPTSAISLRVLNGSGVSGQAAEASAALKDAGFIVNGTGDGTRRNATIIRYAKGSENKAKLLATYIGGGAAISLDTTISGVDAIITTGSGFTGVTQQAASTTTAVTEAPPTMVPSTTTTTASPFVPSGECG